MRDAEINKRMRRHNQILLIVGAVALLAFALKELPDGRVAFRGLLWLPLPQTCYSRSLLGLKCPGCGLTRSIIHLAEGDFDASLRSHRLGWVIALLIALQMPYRLLALRLSERELIAPHWQAAIGYALIALLLGNWLVELAAGRIIAI
jgi:hypothetical protein